MLWRSTAEAVAGSVCLCLRVCFPPIALLRLCVCLSLALPACPLSLLLPLPDGVNQTLSEEEQARRSLRLALVGSIDAGLFKGFSGLRRGAEPKAVCPGPAGLACPEHTHVNAYI